MSIHKISMPVMLLLILFSLILGGCAPSQGESVTLRLALLPVLDTLPVHVALEEGYFEEEGITVELIPVSSAPERDQLLGAGKADGMLNEIVSTMLFNQDKVRLGIVRIARAAASDAPLFRILASGESGITTVDQLKGVPIGISEGTVIEYVTDRLLQEEDFTEEEIVKIPVPKIPDRLALLGSGEIQAAVLPDPLSSLAVQNGAVVVIDDSRHPAYGLSVFSFRTEVLEEHPAAVRAFTAAVEQAVEAINKDPGRYADLMAAKELVPPPVMGDYQVQQFPTAGVPTEGQWQDVLDWARDAGLITGDVPYQESVFDDYLPR